MDDLKSIYFDDIDQSKPLVIAGPCSAETEEQVMQTARELSSFGFKIYRAGIWKPRTKPGGFEGVGSIGLEWLKKVKAETGMHTATEVANQHHVEEAVAAGVDVLWIGARTSANPFAMQEIADTLKRLDVDATVLVKNPVNPDLELWIGALQRIYNAGIRHLGAIHRGFSAYGKHLYRNMPQWRIPIELRRRYPNLPILCDPSHIGGKRELVAPIAQQALDMSFNGFIIESHCDPECALSDKAQQVTPDVLNYIIHMLVLRDETHTTEGLDLLRQQIDSIDDELLELLNRRMRVARDIGRYKQEHRMPVVQPGRYSDLMQSRVDAAVSVGMSADFMKSVLEAIHEESVHQQIEIVNGIRND
jgi:chorismate mutase